MSHVILNFFGLAPSLICLSFVIILSTASASFYTHDVKIYFGSVYGIITLSRKRQESRMMRSRPADGSFLDFRRKRARANFIGSKCRGSKYTHFFVLCISRLTFSQK